MKAAAVGTGAIAFLRVAILQEKRKKSRLARLPRSCEVARLVAVNQSQTPSHNCFNHAHQTYTPSRVGTTVIRPEIDSAKTQSQIAQAGS